MNLSGFLCLQICWYFNQNQNSNFITFPFLLSLSVREDVIQKTGLVMLGVRDRKNIIKSSTFHLSSGSTPRLLHFQKTTTWIHWKQWTSICDSYDGVDLFPLKFRCSSLYLIIKWNFIILILSNTTVFSMIFLSNSTLILIMIIFIMFVCFAKIHLNNYYIFIHISYNFSSVFCFALNYSHAHQLNCQLL